MTGPTLIERYRRVHRPGLDCRVTSARNLLELHGYRHSYATVQGLSSNFFFSYRSSMTPLEKLTFSGGDVCAHYLPVSGQRLEVLENLAYLFNGELVTGSAQDDEAAQESMFAFLDQGIPVLVAVSRHVFGDHLGHPIRLPAYLSGLRFGSHFVTVVGYDRARGTALVFDTDHMHLLDIPLAVLAQARADGDFNPGCIMQSRKRWAVFLPGSSIPDMPHLMRSALARTVHLWRGAPASSAGAGGLEGIRRLCAELPDWTDRPDLSPDKLKATVYLWRMTSEKLSGGSLGRRCFGMLLRQAGDLLRAGALSEAADEYAALTGTWQQLLAAVEARVFDTAGPRSLDTPDIRTLLGRVQDGEERGFERLCAGIGEAA